MGNFMAYRICFDDVILKIYLRRRAGKAFERNFSKYRVAWHTRYYDAFVAFRCECRACTCAKTDIYVITIYTYYMYVRYVMYIFINWIAHFIMIPSTIFRWFYYFSINRRTPRLSDTNSSSNLSIILLDE